MVLFIMLQHLSVCVMAKPVMKTLDIESGLSDNFVMSVASDNLGYIWVATEFGLNRFDGSKVT